MCNIVILVSQEMSVRLLCDTDRAFIMENITLVPGLLIIEG